MKQLAQSGMLTREDYSVLPVAVLYYGNVEEWGEGLH